MAKDRVTSLVLRPYLAEWTTMAGGGRGGPVVADSGRLDWPPPEPPLDVEAVVSEDGGDSLSPATLAECMAAAGVGLKGNVVLALESSSVLLRVVRLPVVSREELRGMVDLQVDKYSPFPVETLAVDFETLAEDDDGLLVLIAAVREVVADALRAQLVEAGLAPRGVDVDAMGWWELLKRSNRIVREGPEVLVLLTQSIQIIATQNGVPLAFRSLSLSPAAEPQELASQLGQEIDYTIMSLEIEHGALGRPAVSLWYGGDVSAALSEALGVACGGDISVQSLDDLPPVSQGLALRALGGDDTHLNLTPRSWRAVEHAKQFKKHMFVAGGACLAVWLLAVGALSAGFLARQASLAGIERDRDEWSRQAMEVREMRRRVFTLKKYTNQTHSALECLREIVAAQVDGIDLTSFSFRKGETVRIAGEAKSSSQVLDFKGRLDGSLLFSDPPKLESDRYDSRKKLQVFELSITVPEDQS